MNSLKTVAAALCAAGVLAAAPAFAAPSLTFTKSDGSSQTVDPFGGFDYISNATAVSSAPVYDGTTILTTSYLASANAVLDKDGNTFFTPGLVPPVGPANPFEFTIKATIFETATCNVFVGPVCAQATFMTVGGSYSIYYDKTADANRNLGTGYLDGVKIIGGNILPGVAGAFTVNSTGLGGSGNFSFFGDVTFTETDSSKDAYFAPALASTTAGAELKIGNSTTSWTQPTGWTDGGGIPAGAFVFQADGNQSFRPVPEPGTLALVGLSLAGLGFARRRSAKK